MESFLSEFSEDGTEGGLLEQVTGAMNTINKDLESKISSYSKLGLLVNTFA